METIKRKINVLNDENYSFKSFINIFILVMILSGIFGFIYEEIFYRIDLGYFVKRGSTYGPWIPIYFFGGGLITLISYKYKKNPFIVFFINCVVTGILEYGTGFVLYEFFGIRLWDYNTEIWNFGNINGYICLRSILFFGMSSLFLVYLVLPSVKKISERISEKNMSIISYVLLTLFIFDVIIYFIRFILIQNESKKTSYYINWLINLY